MPETKILTGIPKMDELLGGGLSLKSPVLITGPLGSDVEVFGQQIVAEASKSFPCAYFVSDKMPSFVRDRLLSMRLAFNPANLKFIDAYSANLGIFPSGGAEEGITSVKSLPDVSGIIPEYSEKTGSKLIVFDSLASGFFNEGDKKLTEQIRALMEKSALGGMCPVFLFPRITEEDDLLAKSLCDLFPCTITIDSVEENFIERSFYTVSSRKDLHIPFKVSSTGGGISLYVPKVIVTGPYHSGKSTFIHKISTKAVSVDRLGTTVALDHGYVEYKGFSIDLFGTPGQEAFNFILPILARDTFGVILVVDSTDGGAFQRAREMIGIVSGGRIPFVVAANKSDLEGAIRSEEIREALSISPSVPIIRTIARDGTGIFDTLVALFDLIIGFKNEAKTAGGSA